MITALSAFISQLWRGLMWQELSDWINTCFSGFFWCHNPAPARSDLMSCLSSCCSCSVLLIEEYRGLWKWQSWAKANYERKTIKPGVSLGQLSVGVQSTIFFLPSVYWCLREETNLLHKKSASQNKCFTVSREALDCFKMKAISSLSGSCRWQQASCRQTTHSPFPSLHLPFYLCPSSPRLSCCLPQPGTGAVGLCPSVIWSHWHLSLFSLTRAVRRTKRKAFNMKADTSSALRANSARKLKGKHNFTVKMNFCFNLKAFCMEALGLTV